MTVSLLCLGMKCDQPLTCWTDYMQEDLTALGLTASWFREAQDRGPWRDKIQELLEHTQQ